VGIDLVLTTDGNELSTLMTKRRAKMRNSLWLMGEWQGSPAEERMLPPYRFRSAGRLTVTSVADRSSY